MDKFYRVAWLDTGHNPWPWENAGRWPEQKFETYAVLDENNQIFCITGRFKDNYDQAVAIANRLNFTKDDVNASP